MKILSSIALVLSISLVSACHLIRGFKYRKLDVNDVVKIPHLVVKKGSQTPFHYARPTQPIAEDWVPYLDTTLQKSKTYAFLVIRNDSLLYEKYFDKWQDDQKFPSFSVAKSYTAALVGAALAGGKIKSLQEPITTYLPELLKGDLRFGQISVQNILDMRSGIRFNEKYRNVFADVWKMGFSNNLNKMVRHLKIEKPAGGKFEYKSMNTQLLGMVVERAVGKKLSDYLSEKIWQPLSMESDALWHVDSEKRKTVKGFCCLNATARDFAKFGTLFLHKGKWQGQEIIAESWVNACTSLDTLVGNSFYKNQWWMYRRFPQFSDAAVAEKERQKVNGATYLSESKQYVVVPKGMKAFVAKGILGQYIYVNPETNVVIVRLGKNWKHPNFRTAEGFVYDVGGRVN